MRYIHRSIEPVVLAAAKHFPALILTGPRRAGKTTLLRKLFPKASYVLLEDPDIVSRFRSDPRSFLSELTPPAILDEVQNAPEILNYVRTLIDHKPTRKGQWLLTGSQEAPLMKGITESMAGRAAVLELFPLSVEESPKVSLLAGGFPEAIEKRSAAPLWFRSYVQTYLERDVRQISGIRDLATFRRFVALTASRSGQILNRSDLSSALGVSVPTLTQWLSILETTSQILLVPPFYENFGKRIIKSPKLYLLDSGLACSLLGIESEKELSKSPFLGPIFEGFVASEILKHQVHTGKRRALYYFRDQQGLEVDFLVPVGSRRLFMIETKSSRSVSPTMAASLDQLARAIRNYKVTRFLVHRPSAEDPPFIGLRPGVQAVSIQKLLAALP